MTPDPDSLQNEITPNLSSASNRQSSSWDIKNAPRNYSWIVVFQIASAFFSFASVLLITRSIGSEGYGGIVAIIAASQVAQVFINWTSVAVVRFGVDEFIETQKIARTFWVRLMIVLVNLAIVLALSQIWFSPLANWLKLSSETIWLVLIHIAVTVLWLHIQVSLQGAKMPRVLGLLQLVERTIIFIGISSAAFLGQLDVDGAVLIYIFAPAAMIVIGVIRIRHIIFSRFSIDRESLSKIILFSIPLVPFSLVGYFSGTYLDAVFVANFLSTGELGIYTVATQINGIVLQFPTLANTLLLPLIITLRSESENARMTNYFRNVLPTLTLLWGGMCAVLSMVAYFVLPLLFRADFLGAIQPLWILLSSSVFIIPVALGYSALSNASSATYIPMFAAIASAITNVTANLFLIPRYGLIGCAWATLLAYSVNGLIYGFLLKRSSRIESSWLLFAPLPSLAGAIVLSFINNPWIALLVCISLTVCVGGIFWNSLKFSFAFVAVFRKP